MSTACLVVPDLALACELVGRPSLVGAPVAVVDPGGDLVTAATPAAREHGVRAGMTVREATAYCPALIVREPRPARVARASAVLLRAMMSVSPVVEEAEPGVVFADLRGLDGLYPEPAALERAILDSVPSGLGARLGIATHRFTSSVAARLATPDATVRVCERDERDFLKPLPAEWLPLDNAQRSWLRLLGIETLGTFGELRREDVEAQFGPQGGKAWLAARGEDPTPVRSVARLDRRVVQRTQAEPPLVSREAVARTVEQLLSRALREPAASGRVAAQVGVRLVTDDEHLWERVHVLKEPTGDRDRLWTATKLLLDRAEYTAPIAELSLELAGLAAEAGQQQSLFGSERVRRREQVDQAARQLKVRYGRTLLSRCVEVEPWSRFIERRRALMDYDP